MHQTSQFQSLDVGPLRKQFQDVFNSRTQFKINCFKIHLARFDFREIQDVVQNGKQRLPRSANDIGILALLGTEFGF
jgi:hypothetical protein